MMDTWFGPQIVTYTGIVFLLTLSPGADTMLVLRSVLGRGRSAGLQATLGISCGLFFHASLSALGLSAILVHSAAAFNVIKIAGALYLIYLGGQSVYKALHGRSSLTQDKATPGPETSGGTPSFFEGLLTNILNPKVAVFYLAFLPQFIRPEDPVLGKSLYLAGIHGTLSVLWLSTITLFLWRVRGVFEDGRVRSALEGFAGAALLYFGLRLAFERR